MFKQYINEAKGCFQLMITNVIKRTINSSYIFYMALYLIIAMKLFSFMDLLGEEI